MFVFSGGVYARSGWWKGNLHTHSLWSDGANYPETVVDWYKKNGYQFMALSDHNILSQGDKWIDVPKSGEKYEVFKKYAERYGKEWVEQKETANTIQVRLKPLGEFRCLFEESGKFLLIQAEEITGKKPKIHINAFNLLEPIQPAQGDNESQILQDDADAVQAQSRNYSQMMFAAVNHPNFYWTLAAEDIMKVGNLKFFEVYNGHPKVHNSGDFYHTSTERMWDIILTKRLARLNLPVIYGIATDDAHKFHEFGPKFANPGRGWIMVRADYLTPESIIAAMNKGDFYASTGVLLKDVRFDGKKLKVAVDSQIGVSYTIQFIGTLKGCDLNGKPVIDANGVAIHTTQTYNSDIGRILAEAKGTAAVYTCTGDEIYIRAKIISSKLKRNASVNDEVEVAWTQPVIPNNK